MANRDREQVSAATTRHDGGSPHATGTLAVLMLLRGAWIAALLLSGCVDHAPLQGNSRSPSFDRIVMQRTGCYGRCPAYTLLVAANGIVEFKGEEFVVLSGRQRSSVSRSELLLLDKKLNAAEFFRCKPRT